MAARCWGIEIPTFSSSLGIPLLFLLLEWVAENVFLFLEQILVVADNVVVEATLPEMPGTDKAALFVIIEPVESGDRLICSEHISLSVKSLEWCYSPIGRGTIFRDRRMMLYQRAGGHKGPNPSQLLSPPYARPVCMDDPHRQLRQRI